jgi:hypothetical protein
MVECLPSKQEALRSNLSTMKEKEKTVEDEEEEEEEKKKRWR